MNRDKIAKRILKYIVPVEDNEISVMLLSTLFFFLLFAGYYPLRALRETMGVESGVGTIPLLWTATLVAMLLINPVFSLIVGRFTRRVFIPYVYRFFILNLIAFFVLNKLLAQEHHVNLGRAFYVWLSVFNLFVVSVAWGFIDDIFSSTQGKRLFGFITSGASIGGIVGSLFTWYIADKINPINVMILSMLFLEASAQCIRPLDKLAKAIRKSDQTVEDISKTISDEPLRGSIWDGFKRIVSSKYLLGICLFMFFLSLMGTFLYMVQADIAKNYFDNTAERLAFFAKINLFVNAIAAIIQIFLTSRLIKHLGVGLTLGLLPIVAILLFAGLGLALLTGQIGLIFWVFIVVQVSRRAGNYALARPSREILYTVLPRVEKYKSKTFIDTFITRASDQVNSWGFWVLNTPLGIGVASIMMIASPLAACWFLVAMALGKKQKVLAERLSDPNRSPCPSCGCDLRNVDQEQCPECGIQIRARL